MKLASTMLAAAISISAVVAAAQVPGPGGATGQPPMGQPGPGGIGQGQHIPGVGEPGLGGSGRLPGDDTRQQTRTGKKDAPKVDDDTLMRQVHEQLAHSNAFTDVRPSVNNGVVTLEGSVPQKSDRKQAKQTVESIPGVRKVRDKLTVKPGGASASIEPESVGGISGAADRANPNPETAQNNAGSISGNASAASGTTAGTASMGQAGSSTSSAPSTNPGTTPASNAGAATSSSEQPQGAPSKPDATGDLSGTTMPDTGALQGQIQTAFKNDPDLRNSSIIANVTDDSIELTGTVNSGKDRQTAKSIAESYAGNRKVIDHIKVKQ